MERPLVSVVTPSYNQAEFLEQNIKSVKEQKYPHIEHIVVDGGSDDGTVDLLREHENDYDLHWVSEPDRGQSHAVNKGVEMAEGDWIGWQNSDDYYLSESFEIFDQYRESFPDVDVIYGDIEIVDGEGNLVDKAFFTPPSEFLQRHGSNLMANQAAFIRKSVFQEVGGLREDLDYCMDIDLFWRLLRADVEMVHVPEYLAGFRVHEDAKTSGMRTDPQREELRRIRERFGAPTYERLLPERVFQFIAFGLKAAYLLRIKRLDAFRQDLGNVM